MTAVVRRYVVIATQRTAHARCYTFLAEVEVNEPGHTPGPRTDRARVLEDSNSHHRQMDLVQRPHFGILAKLPVCPRAKEGLTPVPVVVPQSGVVDEIVLVEWLSADGDRVEDGESLATIETDKAQTTLESPASGVLTIAVPASDEPVPGDSVLPHIAPSGTRAGRPERLHVGRRQYVRAAQRLGLPRGARRPDRPLRGPASPAMNAEPNFSRRFPFTPDCASVHMPQLKAFLAVAESRSLRRAPHACCSSRSPPSARESGTSSGK